MGKLLLNISNHPSQEWEGAQRDEWDKIIDIPFPSVDPHMSMGEVVEIARGIQSTIHEHLQNEEFGYLLWYPIYVMVEGEFSLTFALTELLRQSGWFVSLAFPTSERLVDQEGRRQFRFSGWRFVSLRKGQVATPGFIALRDGRGFEVFARCDQYYIGRVNDGEIMVISEDDPEFPENPNQNEFDEEGNLVVGWEPYYNGVPVIYWHTENDLADPINQTILVSLYETEEGWQVLDRFTETKHRFSEKEQARRFACERALWGFYKTNQEVLK